MLELQDGTTAPSALQLDAAAIFVQLRTAFAQLPPALPQPLVAATVVHPPGAAAAAVRRPVVRKAAARGQVCG
jgi:hypothetical protein